MRGLPWTERDLWNLKAWRGAGMTFEQIAVLLPGRTAGACAVALYSVNVKLRRIEILASTSTPVERKKPGPKPKPVVVRVHAPLPQLAAAEPPSPTRVSYSTLLADAELRARIEIRGITGGLCGDPAPGRSALDRKLAGEPDPPAPFDRRSPHTGRKPTLAGGGGLMNGVLRFS